MRTCRFFGMSGKRTSACARASSRRVAYQAWNEEAKIKENFSVCSNSNQSVCISWHFAGFSMLINAYKHVSTAPISVRRVRVCMDALEFQLSSDALQNLDQCLFAILLFPSLSRSHRLTIKRSFQCQSPVERKMQAKNRLN